MSSSAGGRLADKNTIITGAAGYVVSVIPLYPPAHHTYYPFSNTGPQ